MTDDETDVAVSHQPTEGAHTMSADCWCQPIREKFNAEEHRWYVWNYETEEWEPKTDDGEEG